MGHNTTMLSAWIWKNKVLWLVLLVGIGVGLDQATKLWAEDALTRPHEVTKTRIVDGNPVEVTEAKRIPKRSIEVVPGFFNFKYAENPAAAFSLTGSLPDWLRRPMLLLISSLASLFLIVWYLKMREADALLMTAFALIVAGAVGNLIDRARLGYVIDFLDLYISHPGMARWLAEHLGTAHWPTFNIADMCIVGGAIGVIFRTVRPLSATSGETPPQDKTGAAPAAA